MDYYKGSLYINRKNYLYIYNLETNLWTQEKSFKDGNIDLSEYIQCVYNDNMYLILGWEEVSYASSNQVYKIDLSSERYELVKMSVLKEGIPGYAFGYDCDDNLVFQFAGDTIADGDFNNLSVLDLFLQDLEFENLSERLEVPTARKGHAMEAYDDKLYIFGGINIIRIGNYYSAL
jgi:hypothetical protein